MHQHRIAQVGLRRRNILDPMPLPQPVCAAKRLESAFRADPGAGQDDDVAKLGHGRSL
jgi:hypothetical protein